MCKYFCSRAFNLFCNCYYVSHSVGGEGNRIENCLVEDCDWSATDAAAISVTGTDHVITYSYHTNGGGSYEYGVAPWKAGSDVEVILTTKGAEKAQNPQRIHSKIKAVFKL